MDTPDLDAREAALLGITAEASALALGFFGRGDGLGVSMKGAQDWLTEADGAVERLVRARIGEAFPEDAVFGEETGGEGGRVTWIIDPIDGTANFARGDRTWCVSIGVVSEGMPALGAIHAPALDELFFARRGRGASLNGAPIRAAATASLDRATLEIGWSKRRPLETYLGWLRSAFEAGAGVKRSGSGSLGLMQVAAGRIDAYAEPHINSWDVAAGLVIAAEAGCILNDFRSGDWLRNGNPILCSAPALAGELAGLFGLRLEPSG